ncbi:MAG: hypothetical protein DRP75_02610 [Candidatus Omnitrophota bacterium]|nr:MAG: hypothetical protein DRP75_02610 [Candidatus Omnitrophota bacterium]
MKERLKQILNSYHNQREALLPCLHLIQKEEGGLSEEIALFLAKELNLPPVEVYSVASFYSMFTVKQQKAKYIIRVCVSLPCYLKGSDKILEVLHKELGINSGEVSADKKFFIEEVSCLGACGKAPVMLINETLYDNLTPEKVREIISQLKDENSTEEYSQTGL